MHCVDLGESFPASIYLQKSASIQPRTSPSKFTYVDQNLLRVLHVTLHVITCNENLHVIFTKVSISAAISDSIWALKCKSIGVSKRDSTCPSKYISFVPQNMFVFVRQNGFLYRR